MTIEQACGEKIQSCVITKSDIKHNYRDTIYVQLMTQQKNHKGYSAPTLYHNSPCVYWPLENYCCNLEETM